jgi:hypothetical protein
MAFVRRPFTLFAPTVVVAIALLGVNTNPARSASTTRAKKSTKKAAKNVPTTVAASASSPTPTTTIAGQAGGTPDGVLVDESNGPGRTNGNGSATVAVSIDGPPLQINSEQAAVASFTGAAGQTIVIRSNRAWSLDDPFGSTIDGDNFGSITLASSGKFLVRLGAGLKPPAILSVRSIDPNTQTIATSVALGQQLTFNPDDPRTQLAKVQIQGGQRYRLIMPSDQQGGTVCAFEREQVVFQNQIACVHGELNANTANPPTETTFALDHDASVTFTAVEYAYKEVDPAPTALPARAFIAAADNDIIADVATNPIIDAAPAKDQSIVVPFWGSPAQRAVISSPNESLVTPWGDPWIDKEDGLKVSAVPIVYSPTKPPFVDWRTTRADQPNKLRYGVYRGEDVAAQIPITGDPVTIRNQPWFAAIGSMKLNPGDRYVLQVTGSSIRPVSLALRDPSGKFSSALSPWQWTEDNGKQRAVTSFTADRGGLWAVELRPNGNAVKDMQVSLLKVGGGGSYEGSIEIDDVLTIGEKTDIQLGPNEFARLTVKLKNPIPQIVQPEVLRYRNNTFQPTAVDLSLWDYKGRLVWSNNRNLEEEVLSGRLGKEPQLSEKFAVAASPEPYTLVVDPHTDLAGRFRISVTSTAVSSDVALGSGTIPVLLDGTRSGVVEVRTPTRYRVTGTTACLAVTSFAEWNGGQSQRCVASGRTISLPVGVHRFSFAAPVTAAASFEPVAAGAPPDPVPTVAAAVSGSVVALPKSVGIGRVTVNLNAGDRVIPYTQITYEVIGGKRTIFVPANGAITYPNATWAPLGGLFVAPATGQYVFTVELNQAEQTVIGFAKAPPEVQPAAIAIGAKFKVYKLQISQRLEATVVVKKKTRIGFDTFGYVRFLYAADNQERRYLGESDVVLPPGTYRFVFTGSDEFRIALKKLPLQEVVVID